MKWLKWLIFVAIWTVVVYTAYDFLFDYEVQMWDRDEGSGHCRMFWYTGILVSALGTYFNWWNSLKNVFKTPA